MHAIRLTNLLSLTSWSLSGKDGVVKKEDLFIQLPVTHGEST